MPSAPKNNSSIPSASLRAMTSAASAVTSTLQSISRARQRRHSVKRLACTHARSRTKETPRAPRFPDQAAAGPVLKLEGVGSPVAASAAVAHRTPPSSSIAAADRSTCTEEREDRSSKRSSRYHTGKQERRARRDGPRGRSSGRGRRSGGRMRRARGSDRRRRRRPRTRRRPTTTSRRRGCSAALAGDDPKQS